MNESQSKSNSVEAQNETNVGAGRDGSSSRAKLVESRSFQAMSVREQAKAVKEADEEADERDVIQSKASPEDYILDSHQVDVETEEDVTAVDGEDGTSLRDVLETREEAKEARSQRCGMDIERAKKASSDVTTPEKILGRTDGETYLVMGNGLAMGALVRFETIKPSGTYEKSDASSGSALSKNEVSDVFVEARVTMVTGRDTMGITTEGDLDVEDTSEAEGVMTVRGPGQVLVDEALLDIIPNDAKWFADP